MSQCHTMLCDCCGRSLQHVLGMINERLEEFTSSKEIKVFDDLEGQNEPPQRQTKWQFNGLSRTAV